jgi:hypothetical protein
MSQVTKEKLIPENSYLDTSCTPWQKLHIHMLCEKNRYPVYIQTSLRIKRKHFRYGNNDLSVVCTKGVGSRIDKIYRTLQSDTKYISQSYQWWLERLIFFDNYDKVKNSWLDNQIKNLEK